MTTMGNVCLPVAERPIAGHQREGQNPATKRGHEWAIGPPTSQVPCEVMGEP